jgi:large subunit ribosomal protein L4
MQKAKLFNQAGKELKDIELNSSVYGVAVDGGLVHQVVVAQRANARHNLAHTKDRSEVRGGGKKPWKQKGTGRARHGSSRSPIWIGGGVTFGPRNERNFSQKVNKKVKRKALAMTLSDKVANQNLIVLDKLELSGYKTKEAVEVINALPTGKKVLVVLPKSDQTIYKSFANLPKANTIVANSLNVIDVLHADTLVVLEEALPVIESQYALTK